MPSVFTGGPNAIGYTAPPRVPGTRTSTGEDSAVAWEEATAAERKTPVPGGQTRRRRWERRYRRKQGADFIWYLDRAPTELVELVESHGTPGSAALDLGCGPGVITAYLAGHFAHTVGLDIAHAACRQALQRARDEGVAPTFVVAEAPTLPFRSEAFSFIFDRGCLQAIPRAGWPTYFDEISRTLRPGGVLQLFVSKPMKRFPPIWTYRGARARARWMIGRRGAQFLSHDLLQRLAAPSLQVVSLEDSPYQPSAGPPRTMTRGLFSKP